jgi:hypothetical protein
MGQDTDDYKRGQRVLTPCGRPARVLKCYGAESKYGNIERVLVRYLDTDLLDTVALQPHLLRLVLATS